MTKKPKARMGRPPLKPGDKRAEQLLVRMTVKQKQAFDLKAKEAGFLPARFALEILLKETGIGEG